MAHVFLILTYAMTFSKMHCIHTRRLSPKNHNTARYSPTVLRRIAEWFRILGEWHMESGTPSTTSVFASPWTQLVIGIVCMASVANLQYGWTLFVNPMDAKSVSYTHLTLPTSDLV